MGIKVEERSLQLALVKAAAQLGVTQDLLGYKVISEKTGFLGLFGRKVLIEAWAKSHSRGKHQSKNEPRKRPFFEDQKNLKTQRPDRAPRTLKTSMDADAVTLRQDIPPLSGDDLVFLKKQLVHFCTEICSFMTDDPTQVHFIEEDQRLILDIENDFLSQQSAKNPKLAESFEHILRRAPKGLKQELPFRLFVDFSGIRRHRENELIDMAQDLSNQVFQNKKPVVLNYKSSYDRKIIHMALDKDARVYTKSIGSGPNRKLMILPAP